jgi:Amt family ammonium transporter
LAVLALLVVPTLAQAADPVLIGAAADGTKWEVNTGDHAWMLVSTALVLMMTGPGLALFYGGLVRRKNVLSSMMHSFVLMAVVSIVWAVVGYSLAFDSGNAFFGGMRFAFLQNVGAEPVEYATTIPHTTWMVYQLMFAIITPGLISGAYAERIKFSSMLLFSVLWLLFIYCPLAHMVWAKGGLLNAWNGGKINAIDFAGGTVVHISSGVSALVAAIVLGKRKGFGKIAMPPHSVVISVIGAALLWVGWFGFNAGSALSAGPLASSALIATHFAAAAATLGWMFVEWIKGGKPTVLGAISGAVAGLVVITPAAGFVSPMSAILMGFIGGIVCFFAATTLKHVLGYDDSLDAFGVHGVGGTLGAVLTGIFAVSNIPAVYSEGNFGLITGGKALITAQVLATGITWVIAIVGAFVLLKLVDVTVGLRVTEGEEMDGLDITQHGEAGYNLEDVFSAAFTETGAPAVKDSKEVAPAAVAATA